MKKIAPLFLLGFIIFNAISCSKDSSSSSSNNTTCKYDSTSLIGVWKFDNVKDTNNTDILSKLDNCVVDMTMTYSKDSLYKSKCNNGNTNGFAYTATTENGKYYLNVGTYKIEVNSYDCKSLTYTENINRPGLYVGKAFYTFKKQ